MPRLTKTSFMSRVAAFLLGGIYCLAFAPHDYWIVAFVSLVGFFFVLVRFADQALSLSLLFGVGKYLFGASWIYVSIREYGGAGIFLASFLVALFVMGLALFLLPVGYSVRRLKTANLWVNAVVFVLAWSVSEWLLTWLFTGFPWLLLGYSLIESPLASLLPVFGVLASGMLALIFFLGAALACRSILFTDRNRWHYAVPVLVPSFLALVLHNITWVSEKGLYSVGLVQGNIDQSIKWDFKERNRITRKYISMSAELWGLNLVVWPEYALTLYGDEAKRVKINLQERAIESGTNLLLGAPEIVAYRDEKLAERFRVFNTAQGFGLASGSFAKSHLVPFGDYVPFQEVLRGLITFFDLPMSSSSKGSSDQPNIVAKLGDEIVQIGIGICYEIAFGDSMRIRAREADLLVTITNDTWFGASIGPHQHMQIARVRALENGRWLVRAANDGITGIIDHNGNVRDELPQFTEGVLKGEFQTMEGRTPYNLLGNTLFFAMLIVLGVMVGLYRYKVAIRVKG